jgi:hypothetical protein
MELIHVETSLSLFQRSLRNGVSMGLVSDEKVEAIRVEGAKLVLSTIRRYFPSVAKEVEYQYAVRMVDAIVSYGLAISGENREVSVATLPLGEFLKRGIIKLKALSMMPHDIVFATQFGVDELQVLSEKVRKNNFSVSEYVDFMLRQEKILQSNKEGFDLAKLFLKLSVSSGFSEVFKEIEIEAVACERVIFSFLFSKLMGISSGCLLTEEEILKTKPLSKTKFVNAHLVLEAVRQGIPQHLVQVFDQEVDNFFADDKVAVLLSSKRKKDKADLLCNEDTFPLYVYRTLSI